MPAALRRLAAGSACWVNMYRQTSSGFFAIMGWMWYKTMNPSQSTSTTTTERSMKPRLLPIRLRSADLIGASRKNLEVLVLEQRRQFH